jgi:hypothetical protein
MTTLVVHIYRFLSSILVFARRDHAADLVVSNSDLVMLASTGWLSLDTPQIRIRLCIVIGHIPL